MTKARAARARHGARYWRKARPLASQTAYRLAAIAEDVEGLIESGELEDFLHGGLETGQRNVTACRSCTLQRTDQRRESGAVDEARRLEIDDDSFLSGRHDIAKRLIELRRNGRIELFWPGEHGDPAFLADIHLHDFRLRARRRIRRNLGSRDTLNLHVGIL